MTTCAGQMGLEFSAAPRLRVVAKPRRLLLSLVIPMLAIPSVNVAQSQFTEEVPRVLVDVVVRDQSGTLVRDLVADDFVVYEDGKPQAVIDLQLITADETAAAQSGADKGTVIGASVSPAVAGGLTRPERVPDFSNVSATVFVVDFEGLDWLSKERFGDAMARLLAQRDRLAAPWAVYMIDQLGYLSEVAPLTVDRAELERAIERVRTTPLVRQSRKDELISGGSSTGTRRFDTFAERARAIRTFQRLAQFADSLGARDGRTALVWISSGVQLLERAHIAAQGRSFATPWPKVMSVQQEFHRAANSGRVSVYGVDPSRLIDLIPDTADARHGTVLPGAATPTQRMATSRSGLDAMRDSLREAADATGGRAFVAWSDLQEVVGEIERDAGTYYILSYRPPEPHGDGAYHDIRVQVDRPSVQVRARRGYVDYSIAEKRSRRVSAALALPGTTSGLTVGAEVYRAWLPDGKASVLVVATVQAKPDTAHRIGGIDGAMEAHVVVVTPAGTTVSEASGYAQRSDDSHDDGTASPVSFRHTFSVDPGTYSVRVAFRDEASDRIGATARILDVPELNGSDWYASDPLVLLLDGAGNRRPAFGSSLHVGEQAIAVIEVYNGVAPSIGGYVTRAAPLASSESAPTPARLADVVLGAAGNGLHRGTIVLPELPPGEYELSLVLSDSVLAGSKMHKLRFTVSGS